MKFDDLVSKWVLFVGRFSVSALNKSLKRFPALVKECLPVLNGSLENPEALEDSALGACKVLMLRPVLRHLTQVRNGSGKINTISIPSSSSSYFLLSLLDLPSLRGKFSPEVATTWRGYWSAKWARQELVFVCSAKMPITSPENMESSFCYSICGDSWASSIALDWTLHPCWTKTGAAARLWKLAFGTCHCLSISLGIAWHNLIYLATLCTQDLGALASFFRSLLKRCAPHPGCGVLLTLMLCTPDWKAVVRMFCLGVTWEEFIWSTSTCFFAV